MPQAFISYRRDPSAMLANFIAEKLKDSGVDAYLDVQRVDSGGPFPDRLLRAIKSSDVFICLVAETTFDSDWVRREIVYAHRLGKVMIPVFQESYTPLAQWPDQAVAALMQSDGVHVLDKKNILVEESVDKLVRLVRESIRRRTPRPARPAIPRLALAAVAGIGALAAVVVLLLAARWLSSGGGTPTASPTTAATTAAPVVIAPTTAAPVVIVPTTAVPAPPPMATPPGGGYGQIAFTQETTGGDLELYLIGSDGAGLTRLSAAGSRMDARPSWSPDGTRIVFQSERDRRPDGEGYAREIYIMNADGSNARRLTYRDTSDGRPAWSPDGRSIAFQSRRDGDYNQIYVMNADGSGVRRLTDNTAEEFSPRWSPDGRLLFSSTRDGNGEIYVMNADGSRPINLTRHEADDYTPAWSPDGRRIVFVSNRANLQDVCDGSNPWEIYTMNPDGSDVRRLTDNCSQEWETIWSPDSRMLAFVSNRDDPDPDDEDVRWELYVMNSDGTGLRRLTDDGRNSGQFGIAWR